MAGRQGKLKFTDEELHILVDEVMKDEPCLFGCHATMTTQKTKSALWDRITNEVNTVAACPRTVHELKEKWHDMKLRVCEKVALHRLEVTQSRGRCCSPLLLKPWEMKIQSLLDTDSLHRVESVDSEDNSPESCVADEKDGGKEDGSWDLHQGTSRPLCLPKPATPSVIPVTTASSTESVKAACTTQRAHATTQAYCAPEALDVSVQLGAIQDAQQELLEHGKSQLDALQHISRVLEEIDEHTREDRQAALIQHRCTRHTLVALVTSTKAMTSAIMKLAVVNDTICKELVRSQEACTLCHQGLTTLLERQEASYAEMPLANDRDCSNLTLDQSPSCGTASSPSTTGSRRSLRRTSDLCSPPSIQGPAKRRR
ncbi:hypothetical protein NDU88_004659 [Pleurodeles waltl]|uniref:Myb/SANT-like DNA-binding domain-containing protein n=1 Tax=Pleurodeles waltl TaxID=8319 RepID=A0AAV7MU36_PLEWA|nr:hypothetical protein NDU88_004659 [Pleurodeles waltl]